MNHYMGNTYNGPKHNVFALMTILAVAKALWMVFTGTLCLMMPLDRLGLVTARGYRLALLAEYRTRTRMWRSEDTDFSTQQDRSINS